MHRIFRNSNVDQCISSIEKFFIYANELGYSKKQAMSHLIAFFMKKPLPNSLLENNNDPKVASIKRMCRVMDSRVRMGLLLAIPEICSKLGDYEAVMPNILGEKDAAVNLISAFYHQMRSESANQMRFKMNDAWSHIKTESSETALLFCMQTFVPTLVISGDFPTKQHQIDLFNKVLDAFECKTTINYSHNAITSKNPQAMSCFLKSMNVANRLALTHGSFEDWTANDLQQFVQMIRSCPHLTRISLAHMNLEACCKDEAKFNCILELISLPQLEYLDLTGNHLDRLERGHMKQLNEAISVSSAAIQIKAKPHQIVTQHSLFVPSSRVVEKKERAAVKQDDGGSLYKMEL